MKLGSGNYGISEPLRGNQAACSALHKATGVCAWWFFLTGEPSSVGQDGMFPAENPKARFSWGGGATSPAEILCPKVLIEKHLLCVWVSTMTIDSPNRVKNIALQNLYSARLIFSSVPLFFAKKIINSSTRNRKNHEQLEEYHNTKVALKMTDILILFRWTNFYLLVANLFHLCGLRTRNDSATHDRCRQELTRTTSGEGYFAGGGEN